MAVARKKRKTQASEIEVASIEAQLLELAEQVKRDRGRPPPSDKRSAELAERSARAAALSLSALQSLVADMRKIRALAQGIRSGNRRAELRSGAPRKATGAQDF